MMSNSEIQAIKTDGLTYMKKAHNHILLMEESGLPVKNIRADIEDAMALVALVKDSHDNSAYVCSVIKNILDEAREKLVPYL